MRIRTGREQRGEIAAAERSGRGKMTAAAAAGRVLAATACFAVLHSALASRAAKAAAARLFRLRTGSSVYRAFFTAQAAVASAGLALYLRQLPDRELYSASGPVAVLMRAGQAAGMLLLIDAVRQVGVLPLTGASGLMHLSRRRAEEIVEVEAQGPSLRGGVLNARGAFLRSRHPLNLAPIPVLWLNPRMTRNLALFNAIATAYFWLGSVHEERRLIGSYGEAYRRYVEDGRVPFFFGPRTLAAPSTARTFFG